MGSDFVYGYIQLMDMEKDPRNLMLAFKTARIIIQNFSLGKIHLINDKNMYDYFDFSLSNLM